MKNKKAIPESSNNDNNKSYNSSNGRNSSKSVVDTADDGMF